MKGKRLALRIAVLTLTGLGLVAPQLATAIEIQLPGERKMELHGFYELRLQVLGEDWPANGMSMSQFRHVLNVETETEIFPDGWGPFDFMMAYSRFIVLYECAYHGGCVVPGFRNQSNLFDQFDFYGGDAGDSLNRQPRNLVQARNPPVWAGGLLQMRYRPGTIRSSSERLNDTIGIPAVEPRRQNTQRRYRGAVNPPGALNNPDPLAILANLNQRSKLDEPVRIGGASFQKNRAGGYASRFHPNYLQSARSTLGEENFGTLRDQFLNNEFLVNQIGAFGTFEVEDETTGEKEFESFELALQTGQVRSLNLEILRGNGAAQIA